MARGPFLRPLALSSPFSLAATAALAVPFRSYELISSTISPDNKNVSLSSIIPPHLCRKRGITFSSMATSNEPEEPEELEEGEFKTHQGLRRKFDR